jgi:hypothetical protein
MPNLQLRWGHALIVILSLAVGSSSCLFQKKPAVFTPPAPQSRPDPATTAAPSLPAPPKIAGDANATAPPTIPPAIPETPAPPARPPRRGPAAPPPPKAAPPPAQTDPTPPATTPTPPRLGQIFTPDQVREYNRSIDESLERVKKALATLSRKNLNAEQSETVSRISAFQKQAEQAREAQDLANAELLAKRADLLATDLLTRVP